MSDTFINFEASYLMESDFKILDSLKEKDLILHYIEIKEQLLGQKMEWYYDVIKCSED